MEKDSKKDNKKTQPASKKMKFVGVAITEFRILKKVYSKDDLYKTNCEDSFKTLINSNRIVAKNDK